MAASAYTIETYHVDVLHVLTRISIANKRDAIQLEAHQVTLILLRILGNSVEVLVSRLLSFEFVGWLCLCIERYC